MPHDRTFDDDFEERAAIQEFDGVQPREIAEIMALLPGKVLRDYQGGVIRSARAKLKSGISRLCLYSPTGSGKTEIAVAIIKYAQQRGKRVLFLAHRKELIDQTSERFYKFGIVHGILQADNTRGLYNSVIIGSIQTVDRRDIDKFDLVIVDECHACAGSKAYRRLFVRVKGAKIIGLTATPFARGMAKVYADIGGPLFEDLIIAATIPELIDAGFLVDCDIYGPSEPDLSKVKIAAGDYQQDQLEEAVDKADLIGDIVTHKLKHAPGKQAICFGASIAHSKHIRDQFRAAGMTSEHIDTWTVEHERKRIIREFKEGKIEVLCNVAILAEGFDAPATEVMILARPTRSLIRYIQMVGRVLRPAPGKQRALVLDHSGTCRRLGFPTDDLPLELDDGTPKASSGASERKEPLPTLCASCKYLKPAKMHKCIQCGFAPERQSDVETAAGDLVKVKKAKLTELSKVEKVRIYQELKFIQTDRGYRPGWLMHKYKQRTGSWPPPEFRKIPPAEASKETLSWVKSQMIRLAKSPNNPNKKAA